MAPQLFAQSMECILSMIEQDDPLLAICAAKVLAKTGKYLVAVNTAHPKDECKIALRKVRIWVLLLVFPSFSDYPAITLPLLSL